MQRRIALAACGAVVAACGYLGFVIGDAPCGFQCFYKQPIGNKLCPELHCEREMAIGTATGAAFGGMLCLATWQIVGTIIRDFRGKAK